MRSGYVARRRQRQPRVSYVHVKPAQLLRFRGSIVVTAVFSILQMTTDSNMCNAAPHPTSGVLCLHPVPRMLSGKFCRPVGDSHIRSTPGLQEEKNSR